MTTQTSAQPPIAAFLKHVPLFAQLPAALVNRLAQDFRQFAYPRGNIIFHQGETGRALYIIVSGKVRIYKTTPDGRETTTNIFTTGDVFGEFAIFDQLPRSASAKTLTKCDLLQIGDADFMRHFCANPELALATVRLLAGKTRWTAAIAEALAHYDAANRLVRILLLYVEQFGEKQSEQKYVLNWGLTQSDLASLLGVRREWLNQILTQWRKHKLLTFEQGTLTVLNLPRLLGETERDARSKGRGGRRQ
jgi:CRP/FNR family transcriptional regulator